MNYLAFKKFLAAAGLSTRRFGDLCGIGKTTVHRLAQPGHGGLTPKYVREITPTLLRACRDHLTGSGAPADAIHLVLSDIFGEEFAPSIIARAALAPDILRFFGLARDPFAAPRNASEVFLTPRMEHIKILLEDAVKFQGFVAVLAPVGAGKTVIKNLLMTSPKPQVPKVSSGTDRDASLGPGTLDLGLRVLSPAFPDMSRVTAAGIVAYILESFQLKPRRSLLLAQKQLEDHLAELNAPVALCFDECHRLSDTTLTALKNFYELGTGGFRRYLGLVLFGQPQFETRLTLPRFREIAERLSVHSLAPFSAEDTENFLSHCLTRAFPARPSNSGLSPANGAFNHPDESAPTYISRESPVPGQEPGHIAASTACGSGWLKPGERNFCVNTNGDPSDSLNPANSANSPNSGSGSGLGPETWDLGLIFSPDAIRAIASRAATPLAVANLAAAAMIEAYKKGERQVTARFIPGDREPAATRIISRPANPV